jgi:hypothetical protein
VSVRVPHGGSGCNKGVLVGVPAGVSVDVTVCVSVLVKVLVGVDVNVMVGVTVGVNPGVTVFVGVGVGSTITNCPTTHESLSIILIKRLLSAAGDGTVNSYGNVDVEPTLTQFALNSSQ